MRKVALSAFAMVIAAVFSLACVPGAGWAAENAPSTSSVLSTSSTASKPSPLLVAGKVSASSTKGYASKATGKQVAVIKSGTYEIAPWAALKSLRLGIERGSALAGAGARLSKASGSMAQCFKVKKIRRGVYGIQSTSGLYLGDRDGKVVQTASPRPGELWRRQQWKATTSGGSVTFENVASGNALALAGGSAKAGARAKTAKSSGAPSQRFKLVKRASIVPDGVYRFELRGTSKRLDVVEASWRDGANVRIWSPNEDVAQKFKVVRKGGYYRITNALSRNAVQAGASATVRANVRMSASRTQASQLWRARIRDNGLEFVNKATGGVLGAVGQKPAVGANVKTARDGGRKTQGWHLEATHVTKANIRAPRNLRAIVSHVPGGEGRSIRTTPGTAGYKMNEAQRSKLTGALDQAWRRGEDVSFVMVDLDTGASVSVGADRGNHGASTFKAAYVTYLFQDVWERRGIDGGSISLMAQTIGYSSNEAYLSLRGRFGTAGFRSWLDEVGLGYLAYQSYPRLTARQLALVWTKIYAYQNSGGAHVGEWRSMFDHSYFSCIREALSGSSTVYSKPGWYPKTGGLDALNDAAIVKSRSTGRSYLVAMLSNTSCYSEKWIIHEVARALDSVHAKM